MLCLQRHRYSHTNKLPSTSLVMFAAAVSLDSSDHTSYKTRPHARGLSQSGKKSQKPKSKPLLRRPPARSIAGARLNNLRHNAALSMSFLAGRLAAKEGAYFLQESKTAVGRLAEKLPPPSASAPAGGALAQPSPDVLPEILRHSVPIKGTPPPAEASLSASSRWALQPGGAEAAGLHPDALNPLRSYVSLPQATFGPKRWQLPNEQPNYLASTANERRQDRTPLPMDPEKLKAVIAGYSQIGKAFIAATFLVFGGATAVMLYTADKLQLHSVDDVKTKGKDALQPRADMIKEQIAPLRSWAEEMSRKWHFKDDKEAREKSVIIRELSRALGSRTPPS